jgi:hypothetical protein
MCDISEKRGGEGRLLAGELVSHILWMCVCLRRVMGNGVPLARRTQVTIHISSSLHTFISLSFHLVVFFLTSCTYRSTTSPGGRNTTVILSEKKEQLKAAHETHNENENFKQV